MKKTLIIDILFAIFLLLIFIIVLLITPVGCCTDDFWYGESGEYTEYYPEIDLQPVQDLIEDDALLDDNMKEIASYVSQYVQYQYDDDLYGGEYWQTPLETYNLKTGDCEDKALLFMYFVYQALGVKISLLDQKVDEDRYHVCCYYMGNYYFAHNGEIPTGIRYWYTYDYAMWVAECVK